MACPLLNKLPPELRAKIYEYVLDFDDVPLRHITQLQPFVKKLTGVDGELPFSYEDPEERDPELKWMMIDGDELFGNTPIDTGVLATCKTIYTEVRSALEAEAFMCATEMQSCQLLAEGKVTDKMFLQQSEYSAASDLSLTKRLVITFNSSCKWSDQLARSFNTIDLRNLFTRCGATFPHLQSIMVYTDGTKLPCTSLIDMFQDCHNSPNIFTATDFCKVGQFVASTHSGLTLTVKYKELVEVWYHEFD